MEGALIPSGEVNRNCPDGCPPTVQVLRESVRGRTRGEHSRACAHRDHFCGCFPVPQGLLESERLGDRGEDSQACVRLQVGESCKSFLWWSSNAAGAARGAASG